MKSNPGRILASGLYRVLLNEDGGSGTIKGLSALWDSGGVAGVGGGADVELGSAGPYWEAGAALSEWKV